MSEHQISLESIVQHRASNQDNDGLQTIILITHETTESAVRAALEAIGKESSLVGKPQMIRIEK